MTTFVQEWREEHRHETPEQRAASWRATVEEFRQDVRTMIQDAFGEERMAAMRESRRVDPWAGMDSTQIMEWMGIEP